MTPAARSAVARDVEEAQRDVEEARMSVKKASARSDELLKIDWKLLTRSRGRIAAVPDCSNQKRESAPDGPRQFRCSLDAEMLERHLQQSARHAALGEEHVRRQRELVAELERDGHDASDARRLLELFEDMERMHIAHRDRLARLLGKVS